MYFKIVEVSAFQYGVDKIPEWFLPFFLQATCKRKDSFFFPYNDKWYTVLEGDFIVYSGGEIEVWSENRFHENFKKNKEELL